MPWCQYIHNILASWCLRSSTIQLFAQQLGKVNVKTKNQRFAWIFPAKDSNTKNILIIIMTLCHNMWRPASLCLITRASIGPQYQMKNMCVYGASAWRPKHGMVQSNINTVICFLPTAANHCFAVWSPVISGQFTLVLWLILSNLVFHISSRLFQNQFS